MNCSKRAVLINFNNHPWSDFAHACSIAGCVDLRWCRCCTHSNPCVNIFYFAEGYDSFFRGAFVSLLHKISCCHFNCICFANPFLVSF